MKAIILLSGGIDSTVALAMASQQGRSCHAVSFDYGQRHRVELNAAKAVAAHYGIPCKIIVIDREAFGKTSLVSSSSLDVPKDRSASQIASGGIPSTYVPARNTLFLAFAMAQAELLEADEIHYAPNALDNLPYPDCRPPFVSAFQGVLNVATKQAVEGRAPKLLAPLIQWDKTRIIQEGVKLKAPLHLTFSCYDASHAPAHCGRCDACRLRRDAFACAKATDPTVWA